MLKTLDRLQEKVDHISVLTTTAPSSSGYVRSTVPSSPSQWTPGAASPDGTERSVTDVDAAKATPPHFIPPHRTIVWPAIYSCITRLVPQASSQLVQFAKGGTPWLMYVTTKNTVPNLAVVRPRTSSAARTT